MTAACLTAAAVLGASCLACIARERYTAAIVTSALGAVLVLACMPWGAA